LQNVEKVLYLHPARGKKFVENLEKQAAENKIKIYFKKACQIKKNSYFCTRFETQAIISKTRS
jgi:hypothetical protein